MGPFHHREIGLAASPFSSDAAPSPNHRRLVHVGATPSSSPCARAVPRTGADQRRAAGRGNRCDVFERPRAAPPGARRGRLLRAARPGEVPRLAGSRMTSRDGAQAGRARRRGGVADALTMRARRPRAPWASSAIWLLSAGARPTLSCSPSGAAPRARPGRRPPRFLIRAVALPGLAARLQSESFFCRSLEHHVAPTSIVTAFVVLVLLFEIGRTPLEAATSRGEAQQVNRRRRVQAEPLAYLANRCAAWSRSSPSPTAGTRFVTRFGTRDYRALSSGPTSRSCGRAGVPEAVRLVFVRPVRRRPRARFAKPYQRFEIVAKVSQVFLAGPGSRSRAPSASPRDRRRHRDPRRARGRAPDPEHWDLAARSSTAPWIRRSCPPAAPRSSRPQAGLRRRESQK
jgi:hypothetical protein